jgi:EmrB/QacA subfamily drug resistance transporter
VLAVLCLGVFLINLSTLIVNIALPQIADQLHASTRDLLWIVDAFNLSFAALVLAGGNLSDRFGRRGALIAGLVVFAAGSLAGSAAESPAMLIAMRVVTGVGSAVIYPVTLSIIVNIFTERLERVKAIAIWGATIGLAIGMGPLVGGALVQHYRWGSILLFTGAVAVLALLLTVRYAPDSRDPATPPLDVLGLVLSTTGLGVMIYTIIQAPQRGWAASASLVGFALALAVLTAFVAQERRCPHPMLDVGLFANLRFTAASGAVTIAFFAMFGFIFLIVQYFQLMHAYGPFETGLRCLPVALVTAPAALIGMRLSVRWGNKLVVAGGLLSFTIAFLWISTIHAHTNYPVIVAQMVFLGLGLGFSTAPATEAIMGVVPPEKAGVGSAVNDATRELGGTLGVAVIGSIALSIYRNTIADHGLPPATLTVARSSTESALAYAGRLHALGHDAAAAKISAAAHTGFIDGLHAGCLVAAAVNLLGAVLVLRYLPAHPRGETSLISEMQGAFTGPTPQLNAQP